jgi:hypothetical protein
MLHGQLPAGNFFRESDCEFLAKRTIKFNSTDNCPMIEQGTGQSPLSRPDFKHMFPLYICKVRNAFYRMRIDKEMLIVMRSHFDVNT